MRTTVTLDVDTEALIRRRMREQDVSFKEALNDAIRAGALAGAGERRRGPRFRTRASALGVPAVDLDRALQVAAALEDDEIIRKTRLGK